MTSLRYTVTSLGYSLHDNADVVRMKVVAYAEKQLDVLVTDTTERLHVVSDPFHQVVVGRTSRVDLHAAMPVTTVENKNMYTKLHIESNTKCFSTCRSL